MLSKQALIRKQVKINFIRLKPISSFRVISHMLYSGSDGVPLISTGIISQLYGKMLGMLTHSPYFRQLSPSLGCTHEEEKGECALFTHS